MIDLCKKVFFVRKSSEAIYYFWREMNSVEILPDPPQSFSVALTFQDRTHEQFERSAVQLRSWDLSLSGRLTVKAEGLTELLFRAGSRSVDLVSEDEDRTVGQLLVGQQRVQLGL